MMIDISIETTFTESPSVNVRILQGGATMFYNSERLQGNDRTRRMATILGLTSLPVGSTIDMQITQEQYNQVADL